MLILPFENTSSQKEFNWVGESFADSLADLLGSALALFQTSNLLNVLLGHTLFREKNVLERFLSLLGVFPFRCNSCNRRFFRRVTLP